LAASEPEFFPRDVHEPRVFVVRGLADSIEDITMQSAVPRFRKEHPGIAKTYQDLPGLCMLHTTLLPYDGGITYNTMICPKSGQYYHTPKDLADATRIAVDAARSAFNDNRTDGSSLFLSTLYRSLDPEADANIRRLARDHNWGDLRSPAPCGMRKPSKRSHRPRRKRTPCRFKSPKCVGSRRAIGTILSTMLRSGAYWKVRSRSNGRG